MNTTATLVPDLELPPQDQFDSLQQAATALENFYHQLNTRQYVGGSNPLAESILDTAPIVSLEQYTPEAFVVALEATQSRWQTFVDWLFKLLRELQQKVVTWFKERFHGSAEASHDAFDEAVESLDQVHDAVLGDTDLVKDMSSIPETETIESLRDKFVATFENGLGACIVKLQFKEDLWMQLFAQHIKMCVHVTEEVTHAEDILTAVETQRRSLKGQIAGDIKKASTARNNLERALGLPQTQAKTLTECIQANTKLMHLIEHGVEIRVNPQYLLTNTPSVAAMMVSMNSDEYRANAERDIGHSANRLTEIEAGIERLEKQLKTEASLQRQESSPILREYMAELRAAIVGLQVASHFHIKYVNAHTKIIRAFTAFYKAAATEMAEKQSPQAFARFNSVLNKKD